MDKSPRRGNAGHGSLDHELLFRLLVGILDEIGRNGFAKILIVNGHGGNNGLLDDLLFSLLQRRRNYVVYAAQIGVAEEDRKQWQEMCPVHGEHAGAGETSGMLAILPEMVHLEECKDVSDGEPRDALKHLHGVRNSLWWYADYPTQLAGDPRSATAEKGNFYLGSCARRGRPDRPGEGRRRVGETAERVLRGGRPRRPAK